MSVLRAPRVGATGGLAEPVVLRLAAVVALLAAWRASATWIGTDILPLPTTVAERLWSVWLHEDFLANLWVTLVRVAVGLILSLAVAIVLGIAMGLARGAERFFDGIILFGRSVPGLAWALLAVMIIGVNGWAPVLAVVLAVAPLLTLNIWEGTKALDRDLFQMARVFRAGRARQFRDVVLPAITPSIAGSAKLGLALSWKVTVLAELFGVSSGVGFEINRNFQIFEIDGVVAWALSFAVVMAVLEYGVIGPIYRRLTRWRPADEHIQVAQL